MSIPIEESLRLHYAAGPESCLPSSTRPPSEEEKGDRADQISLLGGLDQQGRVELIGRRDGKPLYR
jgi:hypothetical protein